MYGIGTDIVEIERIKKAIQQHPDRFPAKILSDEERCYFDEVNQKAQYLAGRFAAKEAILKALGTGLRGCSWGDISVLNNELGKPVVTLKENLLANLKKTEITNIHLSISHSHEYAVAFCIIE